MPFSVDIEATNRCNATCSFCPRDLTPHQGVMTEKVFDQALLRTVEFRDKAMEVFTEPVNVTFCGLGEALVNPRTPAFVEKVRGEGLRCALSSNGGLLDERRSEALIDAGLQRIDINIGEIGEAYERIYGLPFDRVEKNVLRFAELAKGHCAVRVVLVDHRGEPAHLEHMRRYWSDRGVASFMEFEIINRGGSYDVDGMRYNSPAERDHALDLLAGTGSDPVCLTPFIYNFIGWDGQIYLCSSDWQKEAPFGSVFDVSFEDVIAAKLRHVETRKAVCGTCNYDPINQLIHTTRAADREGARSDEVDADLRGIVFRGDIARSIVRRLGQCADPRNADAIRAEGRAIPARRSLPVTRD